MTDFDEKMRDLLAEHDAQTLDVYEEDGFYREVWSSFRGPGRELRIWTWVASLIAGAALIYCVIGLVQAESISDKLTFAAFAIMLNSAQIALKLWFNMRLNRRAVIGELRSLRLQMLADKA